MSLVFSTNNTTTGTHLAPQGICNGMTAAWARHSLTNGGCSAAQKTQVEADGLLLATRVRLILTGKLATTPGESWGRMLSTVGLKNVFRAGKAFGGPIDLADELKTYGDATSYIVIRFRGGVHAMGARVTGTTCDLFDPNVGLKREESQETFTTAVTDRMASYPGWTGNVTYVWTLTL